MMQSPQATAVQIPSEPTSPINQPKSITNWCSFKCTLKVFLVFFLVGMIGLLIFTAIRQEYMSDSETSWWWALVGSLILDLSILTTCFILICYIDAQNLSDKDNHMNSTTNASYKSVVTVNSTSMSQDASNRKSDPLIKQLLKKAKQIEAEQRKNADQLREAVATKESDPLADAQKSNFINLTPNQSSNVNTTVVDMRNKKKTDTNTDDREDSKDRHRSRKHSKKRHQHRTRH